MDYNKRRFLLEAIVDAVTTTERKREQKCLVCGDERDLFPASIKITQGPGTFDFKAEVTSTALAKGDGWIEFVDRNAELDSIEDSKPVAICLDCATRKGLKSTPEPTPEALVETHVPDAASVAPSTDTNKL